MKNVLIIGGLGQMGSIVRELLEYEGVYASVADFHDDCVNPGDIQYDEYDLIVSCVPSQFGFKYMKEAVEAGADFVDLSFMPEDPFTQLDNVRSTVITDVGLAPGLTNFIAGHLLRTHGTIDRLDLYVGGVAQDPTVPYGYSATWCIEDLYEEFHRAPKIVAKNIVETHPPFAQGGPMSTRDIEHFQMEYFLTDGLRSLTRLKDRIANMAEYTLRWRGHLRQVASLVHDKDKFINEISDKCVGYNDTVVFLAEAKKGKQKHAITMVSRYPNAIFGFNRLSAMAKTTAFPCAIVANMVLDGCFKGKLGVYGMEDVGLDPELSQRFLSELQEYDITFKGTVI